MISLERVGTAPCSEQEKALAKLRAMKPATLLMVWEALITLKSVGWFDPLEEYAPGVPMAVWFDLVLAEMDARGIQGRGRQGRKLPVETSILEGGV